MYELEAKRATEILASSVIGGEVYGAKPLEETPISNLPSVGIFQGGQSEILYFVVKKGTGWSAHRVNYLLMPEHAVQLGEEYYLFDGALMHVIWDLMYKAMLKYKFLSPKEHQN